MNYGKGFALVLVVRSCTAAGWYMAMPSSAKSLHVHARIKKHLSVSPSELDNDL